MKNNFNPPFSLFREYVKQLMDYGKKFIIIGNMNAIVYKETFPYAKEDKMWTGYNPISNFNLRNGGIGKVGCRWYTNIETEKRRIPLDLYKRYSNEYPKYDNYDAIEVSKVSDIPMDYDGVMGVPITFFDKYCPEQFEIIWRGGDIEWAENECDFYTPPTAENAEKYKKQDKTWRIQNPYLLKNETAKVVYQRIFIRKRNA